MPNVFRLSLQKTLIRDGRLPRLSLTTLLVLVAMGVGFSDLGHDHPSNGLLDEHHCAVCHVQQAQVLLSESSDAEPVAAPRGDVLMGESRLPGSVLPRLSPPLRGPPAS